MISIMSDDLRPGDMLIWSENLIEMILSVTYHREYDGLKSGQINFMSWITYGLSTRNFQKVNRQMGEMLYPNDYFRSDRI
jgi:hypothetical protein